MKQNFRTEELRKTLESALGFRLRSIDRLKCVNSVNFKAVRENDGFCFTVKCLPTSRRLGYDFIVRHLAELKGTRTPERVFEKECPPRFGDYDLLCLKWCEGNPLYPDQLSDDEFRLFLDDYLAFSDSLQRTTLHLAPYEIAAWRAEALMKCAGGWGFLVRPAVEMCEEDLSSYKPEMLRVVHGDLHPGNFAFSGGRVSGFFDLEGLTLGYPAWDFVRYFAFALDHLSPFGHRRRCVLARFDAAVRHLPYSKEEWLTSLNASWLEQVHKKLDGPRVGLVAAIQLHLHARLYRELRRTVFNSSRA